MNRKTRLCAAMVLCAGVLLYVCGNRFAAEGGVDGAATNTISLVCAATNNVLGVLSVGPEKHLEISVTGTNNNEYALWSKTKPVVERSVNGWKIVFRDDAVCVSAQDFLFGVNHTLYFRDRNKDADGEMIYSMALRAYAQQQQQRR